MQMLYNMHILWISTALIQDSFLSGECLVRCTKIYIYDFKSNHSEWILCTVILLQHRKRKTQFVSAQRQAMNCVSTLYIHNNRQTRAGKQERDVKIVSTDVRTGQYNIS
jgi:hypothetical protein